MEKFLKKFPSKIDFAIGAIFGIGLFFAYRVGLSVEEKWSYVLLLILSIVIYKISYDSLSMKLVAVVNILYSVFMFAGIPQFLCTFFWSKIRGPIPDVQCIVKGDKRVYLQKDYDKKQVQLIYRQGSKRKILDTYQWEKFSNIQYSLKKQGTNCLIVQKYSTKTLKQIEEKKYTMKVLW